MPTRVAMHTVAVSMGAVAMLLASAADAALLDRDLNGDQMTDAFYDTVLDITWLRDANVNGTRDWGTAVSWANNFSFGGYTDWRLPTSDECFDYNCTGSEMGHLWYVDLGNSEGVMTNTGGFQNLRSYLYWSGLEYSSNPIYAWTFATIDGYQLLRQKTTLFNAMAVRPGDVAAVPLPQAAWLMLAGLVTLAARLKTRSYVGTCG